jgi:hypothetical protein
MVAWLRVLDIVVLRVEDMLIDGGAVLVLVLELEEVLKDL